jgi:wnt family.
MLQVCSKQIPSMFRPIGDRLHGLYEKAIYERPDQRRIENDANYLMIHRSRSRDHVNIISAPNDQSLHQRSANLVRRRRSSVLFDVNELKFFERSPDFCQKSKYAEGIKNRTCLPRVTLDELAAGVKSCKEVCCRGHGWRWVWREVRKNCKFHYCCKVTCDKDLTWIKEYYCL